MSLLTELNDLDVEDIIDRRAIFIVTADTIGATGTVSWAFLFSKNADGSDVLPDDVQRVVCGLPFGYIWKGDDRDHVSYPFNFWTSKGFHSGGGFEEFNDRSHSPFVRDYNVEEERGKWRKWQQEMLDAIPACTVLMSTEAYEWLMNHILRESDREHFRFHCDQPLPTS